MRAVPLQARALDALDRIRDGNGSTLLFPGDAAVPWRRISVQSPSAEGAAGSGENEPGQAYASVSS
jgi:hypothetical protein